MFYHFFPESILQNTSYQIPDCVTGAYQVKDSADRASLSYGLWCNSQIDGGKHVYTFIMADYY